MKTTIILFSLFFVQQIYGFTLLYSNGKHFANTEITINVSSNNCTNSGVTAAALLDKVMESLKKYWNIIPTTSLEIVKGTTVAIDVSTATSALDFITSVEPGTIIVGCNTDTSAIFTSTGTKGVGSLAYSGDTVWGYLLIRDTVANGFSTLSNDLQLALIAHEIGHAIGIGHSEIPVALMYYSLNGEENKIQEKMTMDDLDAVTYLYPHEKKIGGLGGSCGTIDTTGGTGGGPGGPLTLALGFLLVMMLERLYKLKRS